MNKRQIIGSVVALAAASVFAANTGLADHHEKKGEKKGVKCMGGNACSGKGACASADGSSSCAGKNSCQGKGWTMASNAEECTKAGGKVEEKKKDGDKKTEEKKG